MSTATSEIFDAVAHLPASGVMALHDIPWDEYEHLLAELAENDNLPVRKKVRISYCAGRLNVMTVSRKHEIFKDMVYSLVRLLSWELSIPVETCGSATMKLDVMERAAEPDTAFYVQNAAKVIGKNKIDLLVDPPPDVVVEIEVSHADPEKFELYEGLRVPEFWRYDERRMQFFQLTPAGYVESSTSLAFPMLTSAAMTNALEQSKTQGQDAALRSFHEWLKQLPS
ncbi:MAG: Uma2 family endonuclease [Blastocatellia bacterium]